MGMNSRFDTDEIERVGVPPCVRSGGYRGLDRLGRLGIRIIIHRWGKI